MEVIAVSGTPGTGKTMTAKRIAEKKNYLYIDVNEIIKSHNLVGSYDEERDTKIVDRKKLNKVLIELIRQKRQLNTQGLVIDSHMSQYLPKKYVDKCIITKCDLKKLRKRLEKRGYSKEKVRENLDAEIFDTCRIEALEAGYDIEVIYT